MKKPNFFIVGAPKCGTTSMAHWLSEHPRIFMSPVKEPGFFASDLIPYLEQWKGRQDRYECLFTKSRDEHIAVGEASTAYLYSKSAVPDILCYSPDAKFIVGLTAFLYQRYRETIA